MRADPDGLAPPGIAPAPNADNPTAPTAWPATLEPRRPSDVVWRPERTMMRLLYPPNAVVQAFPRRTCLPNAK